MFKKLKNFGKKRRLTTSKESPESIQSKRLKQKKHLNLISKLLTLTLTPKIERDLLWDISVAFDLPLVIGEQFVLKKEFGQFQSSSYFACLQLSLTKFYTFNFAQNIIKKLMKLTNDFEKCNLAMIGIELNKYKLFLHEYDKCFNGGQLIELLLFYKMAKNKNNCIKLAKLWLKYSCLSHVNNSKHDNFRENEYYQFNRYIIYKKMNEIKINNIANTNIYKIKQNKKKNISNTSNDDTSSSNKSNKLKKKQNKKKKQTKSKTMNIKVIQSMINDEIDDDYVNIGAYIDDDIGLGYNGKKLSFDTDDDSCIYNIDKNSIVVTDNDEVLDKISVLPTIYDDSKLNYNKVASNTNTPLKDRVVGSLSNPRRLSWFSST